MNTSSERSPSSPPASPLHGDRGATGVEYALVGSLIAAVCALTVTLLGFDTLDLWQRIDW